ncbi:MAG: CDP-glycerol glycerophosphotransferase family protein [Candidatus Pacearchaeota archaeon]|nr:CDP-glycerol glycerophosphotransferase family protein [Candidatus Pacearchaeota archaeon]
MSVNKAIAGLSLEKSDKISKLLIPFQILSSIIDFFYPKKDNYIICGSNTGEYFSGSPKAFYEYVSENCPEYKIFHYHPFRKNDSNLAILRYIIKFSPIFYRARYLISSHPPNDFFPFVWWSRRKIFINTWHGIDFKAGFFADSGDTSNKNKILKLNEKTTYFLVSSKLESATKTKIFLINPKKFLYIGQPRNDKFLKSNSGDKLNKIFENLPEHKKIVLYAPTYRRNNPVNFFPFKDFDIINFKQFLDEKKIIFLIRGHVYEKGSSKEFFDTRILNLDQEILEDVYDILSEIDILITDYSSIFIDYLLLNRPLIFLPYDLNNYELNRGLIFDDYDYWTPGKKAYKYCEFIDALEENFTGLDVFKERREEIKHLFHYYQKANTSERLLKFLNEEYQRGK